MEPLKLKRDTPLFERVLRLRDAFSSDDPGYYEIIDIGGDVGNLQAERDELLAERDGYESSNAQLMTALDTVTAERNELRASSIAFHAEAGELRRKLDALREASVAFAAITSDALEQSIGWLTFQALQAAIEASREVTP